MCATASSLCRCAAEAGPLFAALNAHRGGGSWQSCGAAARWRGLRAALGLSGGWTARLARHFCQALGTYGTNRILQEAAPETYDVIIVDSSDPVGPAEVLYQKVGARFSLTALHSLSAVASFGQLTATCSLGLRLVFVAAAAPAAAASWLAS